MDIKEFCEAFPFAYHMAHCDAWPSIREHGLKSTSALLDFFEITGEARSRIERQKRPECVALTKGTLSAVIRDQMPLNDKKLQGCLVDMAVDEWHLALNSKVFFWLSQKRLKTLLGGDKYRHHTHCIITARTSSLFRRHLNEITLCPINSGSTLYNPQPRGRDTFKRIEEYDFAKWQRTPAGKLRNAVVELAVNYQVEDIMSHAIRVDLMNGDGVQKTIFGNEPNHES